eukprot:gene13854-19777_t
MQRGGVSPGGMKMSDGKKRTLAALGERSMKEGGKQSSGSRNTSYDKHPNTGRGIGHAKAVAFKQEEEKKTASFPYTQLPEPVTHGPLASMLQRDQLNSNIDIDPLDAVLRQLCSAAMGGEASAGDNRKSSVANLRVQDKSVLLDNPTSHMSSKANQKREPKFSTHLLSQRRLSKSMNGQQSMQPGSIPCRKNRLGDKGMKDVKYTSLVPLHKLWLDYACGLVSAPTVTATTPSSQKGIPLPSSLTQSGTRDDEKVLLQADFHGCLMTVQRCKNPSHIGVVGIVAKVTTHTFQILTEADKLIIVPLKGAVFSFQLPGRTVVLVGIKYQESTFLKKKR